MSEETQPNGTGSTPTTPAASGNSVPAGNGNAGSTTIDAPPRLEVPPTSTELRAQGNADDKTDYERKFNSMRGTLIERQRQWDEYEGKMTTRLEQRERTIATLTQDLDKARAEIVRLQGELETVPTLKERSQQLDMAQAMNDRLRYAMHFPSIVGQAVEEEGEDGAKVLRNPVLDMVLSSNLERQRWEQMVQEMASRLGSVGPNLPALSMTSPPGEQAPPTGNETLESLRARRMELSLAGDYAGAQELNNQIVDLLAREGKS